MGSTRGLRHLQDKASKDARMREAFREAEDTLPSATRQGVEQPGDSSFLGCRDTRAVSSHELRTRLRHIIPRLEAALTAAQLH